MDDPTYEPTEYFPTSQPEYLRTNFPTPQEYLRTNVPTQIDLNIIIAVSCISAVFILGILYRYKLYNACLRTL